MYYSQHSEDRILAKIFDKSDGLCVEVGANDGVTFSNSKYFEALGWRCILIEPTPELCEKIRKNRAALLFECAASDSNGMAELKIPEKFDLYSSLEFNSTMSEKLRAEKAEVRKIQIRTRTLDELLSEAKCQQLDFISIDVEGHELSVLRGFSLGKWRPSIVIIEDSTDMAETVVSRHMRTSGYCRFYRSGGNDWYLRPISGVSMRIIRQVLRGQFGIAGIAKAWLPALVRRCLILSSRKVRRLAKGMS